MARSIPPSLRRFCRQIQPQLLQACRGRRVLERVGEIVETDRWNSFDRFHQTTRTLQARYEAAGAEVEVEPIPTGGPTDSGRWIIHEAQDISSASLEVIHPFRERLLDFNDNPWHAVQWTAATPREGMVTTLVAVDTEEEIDRLPEGGLDGRTVVTGLTSRDAYSRLARKGAAGILVDQLVPNNPNALAWVKFGWGGLPRAAATSRMVGLVVSHSQGRRLRRAIARHGTLTVRTRVNARKYVGSHDAVSGCIRGADMPEEEIWAFAHSAEPGAIDNAAGVAVCVEVAEVIEHLIGAGAIQRPRRTIRLLHGYECYGLFGYLERVSRLGTPLAGYNVDTVGAKPAVCDGRLELHATVPMSAGFVNGVAAPIVRATLRRKNPGYRFFEGEFVSTADTLLGDPQYGCPMPWLTTHFRADGGSWDAYHSSADLPTLLSADGLAVSAAAVAGYTHYLANAGTAEVLELARMETDRCLGDLHGVRSRERVEFVRSGHHESLKRLQRWLWGGERREIVGALSACERELAARAAAVTARPAVRRRRRQPVPAAARAVPRRLVPITPDSHNTPEAIWARIAATGLSPWTLYWADGKRNLAQIAEVAAGEAAGAGADVRAEQVVDFFAAHADLGYVALSRPDQMVNRGRLVDDLRQLGVEKGMDVMVHSSLSSIGRVVGGAETVVDALVAAVGSSGTVLLPSFNHGRAAVYNRLTTPCINGAIPDAGWRRADAVRSDHPTHAVAAIGRRAEDYCRDHVEHGIWAAESPIGRLVHGGGYILSLGVKHDTSTAYHVAEMAVPCGCLDAFANSYSVVDDHGAVGQVPGLAWRNATCPVALERRDQTLERRGRQQHGKIGAADCTLVLARDLFDVRRQQVKGVCPTCPVAPDIRD